MRSLSLLAVLALALAGCNSKTAEVKGAGAKPGPNDAPKSGSLTVPEDLKNDAYVYYGLGNSNELTYQMIQGKGLAPQEGTQTMSPESEAKDGKMTFATSRGGAMVGMGDEKLSLEKDGLYLVSGSVISPEKPSLVLPAKLDIGTTWDTDTTMTSDKATVKMKGRSKVERSETVKVKAGTYETLLIVQTAEADNNGTKGTMAAKGWYAKGIGIVKMNLEYKQHDGQVVTTTLELVREGKPEGTDS